MKKLLDVLENKVGLGIESSFPLVESLIDYPQEDLDLSIWSKKGDTYELKPWAKRKIVNFIKKYPEVDLLDIAAKGEYGYPTIHIVGSIATNQWVEDSDIDVHIIVSKDSKYYNDEDFQKKVSKWFEEHRDEYDGYLKEHPIEIYLQSNYNQDLLGAGCYDLFRDKWIVGPKIVPLDYDPYEDFSDIADELRKSVQDADLLLGELKRDVIDYETIRRAMERLSPKQKKAFLEKLEKKLEEIEEDIETLYSKREEWVRARREASRPSTPEEALKDVELAKQWRDQDALFKFICRYHYLKTIKELKELLKDDKITPDEIGSIKKIVGIRGNSRE